MDFFGGTTVQAGWGEVAGVAAFLFAAIVLTTWGVLQSRRKP